MRRSNAVALSTAVVALAFSLPLTAQTVLYELHDLTPSDWSEYYFLGWSVSLDGGRALVGSPGADTATGDTGAAYIFDETSGQEIRALTAHDAASGDEFGWSVAIAGALALVGAPEDGDNGLNSGSVYVFDAATGQQLSKLTASDGSPGDVFGWSIALEDGLALVGAPGTDDHGTGSGAVYVFDATTGQELRKIAPADGFGGDQFGHSVALDDGRALVGAPWDDGPINSGSAYLFDATSGIQLLKLTMSNGQADARFGKSVSLSGGLALVGAPLVDHGGVERGVALLFDATFGQELIRLEPPVDEYNGHFGWSVALDGGLALVGAPNHGCCQDGSVYVFNALAGQVFYELKATYDVMFSIERQLGWSVALDGDRTLAGGPTGSSNYYYGTAFVHAIPEPGAPYCFGDPGLGTPCPCANDNDGSVRGSGCANGVFASGAKLGGTGIASVAADTLSLTSTRLEPLNAGLYFQGNSALNGGAGFLFGDGLRCAGYGTIRLQVCFADAAGGSFTTIGIAAEGGVSAGDQKYYQCWYRTPTNPPCGAGVNDFNLTNAYAITWAP
jgi:hypothetical protein